MFWEETRVGNYSACEKIFKKQLDDVQCGAVEAGIYKVNVAVNF